MMGIIILIIATNTRSDFCCLLSMLKEQNNHFLDDENGGTAALVLPSSLLSQHHHFPGQSRCHLHHHCIATTAVLPVDGETRALPSPLLLTDGAMNFELPPPTPPTSHLFRHPLGAAPSPPQIAHRWATRPHRTSSLFRASISSPMAGS